MATRSKIFRLTLEPMDRPHHRSAARWICGVLLLFGAAAQAQPPLTVQWFHDKLLDDPIYPSRSVLFDPNTGQTVFRVLDNDFLSADVNYFQPNGLWLSGFDHFDGTMAPFQLGGPNYVVYQESQGFEFWILVSPGWVEFYSLSGPPTVEFARCSLPAGDSLYIGGNGADCTGDSGTIYTVFSGDEGWRTCIPQPPWRLELHQDTLLAISYPFVSKVNTVTGEYIGSFDIFTNGPADADGGSCIDGDSLYWACEVAGATQVGKYVLGSGTAWEISIPIVGNGTDLFLDDYGRLWTARDNQLIWIDAQTGTYDQYPFGQTIDAMDLRYGALVIAGTMDGQTNFLMRASPTP